jgi:hypothetical protein
MPNFQHLLWGYELTYPESWIHRSVNDTDAFYSNPEAQGSEAAGAAGGQILVRAELNYPPRLIEPVWNQHIAQVAGMLGARQVGSAPWQMAGATGIEAEIVLPKRENQRLWAGILARGYVILKFAVTHPKQERDVFEPAATSIISSLKFLKNVDGLAFNDWGLPLPPGYQPAAPSEIIQDIADPQNWQAFDGQSGVDALQAFYLRELEVAGWEILEYVPFPSLVELGFARMQVQKDDVLITLGILPFGAETVTPFSQGKLAFKFIPPDPHEAEQTRRSSRKSLQKKQESYGLSSQEPGTNHGRQP